MTKEKNPVGRPRIEIDYEVFKKLCELQCTAEEISSVMDMSVDTLDLRLKELGYANFTDAYKKYSDHGKMSVRRWQMKAAESGNASILIWLGKQMLGQTDKVEADYNFSELPKIQVQFVDSNNEQDLDD
jgi:hypothetical protein